MLAVIAAFIFAIGFVLELAGKTFGRMDGTAWVLLGLAFLALHIAFGWHPLDRR